MHGREAVFFFSSRRRHTRLQGDWSSDVCSSDLLFKDRAESFFALTQGVFGLLFFLPLCLPFQRLRDGLAQARQPVFEQIIRRPLDRKSTRLNSSHLVISYAVFCLKKKNST